MADKDKKIDPFDVEALEKSLNDSATRVSTIWVSFLVFSLYLLTAATTVTHRQLFLAEPVKLPVLNIDLPLWGFFFLAPILFVILHAYVLLQVILLARTAAAYNEAVDYNIKVGADNARVRQRLANTLFAQIFAGSPRERAGWLGWLLRSMAWITLAFAPILILLVFQLKFLPYHSHSVTWLHRILILTEVATLLALWPLALDARRDINWGRTLRQPLAMICGAISVLGSATLATFPGEPHISIATDGALSNLCTGIFEWRSAFRAHGSKEFDSLYLPRIDVVDDEKFDKIAKAARTTGVRLHSAERTQKLRDRDFNCSNFEFADLRLVDFTNAQLKNASLYGAVLQGASLSGASLQGASLGQADLREGALNAASLQGANLERANMQDADLSFARLQGASLNRAQLQNSGLALARLQGASLQYAELHGGWLFGANLNGAFIDEARLEGAWLERAHLAGASLRGAALDGANMDGAVIQGADLTGATMAYSTMSDTYVWRAKNVACTNVRFGSVKLDATILTWPPHTGAKPATPDEIAKLIQISTTDIPDVSIAEATSSRMRRGLLVDSADDPHAGASVWDRCEQAIAKIPYAEIDQRHVAILRNLVCSANLYRQVRGPVARGIFRNWVSNLNIRREFRARLASSLLAQNDKGCDITKELKEVDIELLRELALTLALQQ